MSNLNVWSRLVLSYQESDIEEHRLGSAVRSKVTPIEYNISIEALTLEEIVRWETAIVARCEAAKAMTDFIKVNILHS